MKQRTWISSLGIIVLVAISCQGSDLEKMKSVSQASLPDEISKDVELVYSDSGKIKRILKAPLIHKYTKDTNYTVFPEGVHAQFFDKKGRKVTELTCGYGFTGTNNDALIFRKNVKIVNYKKETILSEEIYLKDNTIHSDSTVYIITPSITLRGTSLKAPRDFSSYTLFNPVGVARAEALNSMEE